MSDIAHRTASERTTWAIGVLTDSTAPIGRRVVAQQVLQEIAATADEAAGVGAVAALSELYKRDACAVAQVCDEIADPSGRLLGVVRAKARGGG